MHRLIYLNGRWVEEEHEGGEGGRVAQKETTVKEILEHDHAPLNISFPEPSMELTEMLLKAVERFEKKEKHEKHDHKDD